MSPERLALEVSETALASTAELADEVIGALATQGSSCPSTTSAPAS